MALYLVFLIPLPSILTIDTYTLPVKFTLNSDTKY